jgi:hypothetical protein
MSGASADFQPSEVASNVAADGKSAEISWKTTKDSLGYVEYGTTPASLLLRSEIDSTSLSTSHTVNIAPLKTNMNYYYRIRIGEQESKKSEWEVFDNGGIPYSFNTKVTGAMPPGADGGQAGGNQPTPTIFIPPALAPTVTAAAVNCLAGVDYNHDGVTNSLDYVTCLKGQVTGTVTPAGARPTNVRPTGLLTPTITVTTTPASVGSTKPSCKAGVDYNNDGVTNSLDMVKCLQGR